MRFLPVFCLLIAFGVQAEEKPGFTIFPHVGWTGVDDGLLDNGSHLGLGLGYRFDTPWGVELTWKKTDTDIDGVSGADAELSTYSLDWLYHFESQSVFDPYVSFGYGRTRYDLDAPFDSDNEQSFNAGLGAKWFFSERAAVRAEGKLFHGRGPDDLEHMISVGLHLALGGSGKPAPAPMQASTDGDADRDGVPDSRDNCPGTPYGVEVDSDGCPLDDDGDGVPNYKDKCPGTTDRMARIDADGCYQKLIKTVSIHLNVEFDFNSAAPRTSHSGEVKKVADFMRAFPTTSVVMEGHTDSQGEAAYNQGLSERRAKAIANMLVNQFGISDSRVGSRGYGESSPVATNDTKEGRQKNRRVVATIEEQEEVIEMK